MSYCHRKQGDQYTFMPWMSRLHSLVPGDNRKQPNLLAKWCQVERAKCELCQKENLHLAKKNLDIQMGNIKLSYSKCSFTWLPGRHFAAKFSQHVNCCTLVHSKLKAVSKYVYMKGDSSPH